ncbi:TPA: cupin domain-containing protein [Klebsiella pneumoniae]|nr:cupin domain-containing protein [Klebsiella pneumoniae]
MTKPVPSTVVLQAQQVTLENRLPGAPIPYFSMNDEGERWLVAGMVMNLQARPIDNDRQYEMLTWTAGKGAGLPLHHHLQAHQALYLVAGQLTLWLAGSIYHLQAGDYASVPAGSDFAFRCESHRTRILHFTTGGEITPALSSAGKRWSGHVQPEGPVVPLSQQQQQQIAEVAPICWQEDNWPIWPTALAGHTLPDSPQPYVLANGAGERYVAGDQVFIYLGNAQVSNNAFLTVMMEGPAGEMVPPHFHARHTEIFYPLEGNMTMIANKQRLTVGPGDAVFVTPGTIHGYQLNSHFTQCIGFLTPGVFDNFFRLLGDPWAEQVLPQTPGPLRFDRVLARLDELDLYLCRPGEA